MNILNNLFPRKTTLLLLLILAVSGISKAQISQQWAKTFNGKGDYTDRFTCITRDNSGNIYVGGSTVNIGQNRDYLVLKMDDAGNVIWRQEYNAPGNGPDEITAIYIDGSNNVYVTGFGKSLDVGNDFLTIKYDNSGAMQWVQEYDSPFHQYDQANSIAVDGNGNVIVTGQSDRDTTGFTNDDCLTVKYTSSGAFSWAQQFNGLGNQTDRAVKVVTDNSNNIYIAGRSYNGVNDDFVTIKYNTGGTQLWLQYGDRGHTDRATAMTIDGAGSILVTGRSSNGTNDDYYTIKYSASGTVTWQHPYDYLDSDRPTAIAVDANNNVYVTGMSDQSASTITNFDYRTIKYNSAGAYQWAVTYDGTASNDDIPNSIYVDNAGNIYITGESDTDPSPAISTNIVTIKYASNNTQQWVNTFSGSAGFNDGGNAVTVNSTGNCFIAGFTEDASVQFNGVIRKISSTGSTTLDYTFDGVGDNSDNIRSIAIDNSNNTYSVGYSVGLLSDRNYTVIKRNSNGDTLWTRQLDGTSPASDDEANAVGLDPSGNAIVSGFTKNSGSSSDIQVVKYNSNGDTIWTYLYDSPVHESDRSYDMQVDGSGNIYLTGRSDSDPSIFSNDNCTTIKLDANGNQVWLATYNSPANGNERGNFIRVTSSGNIYVAGRSFNGTNDDILLIKYDNSGNQSWVQFYDGGTGNDQPTGMVIDNNENIYLTGWSGGIVDTITDFVTLKYNSSGSQQWVMRYDGAAGQNDLAEGITLDNNNNVIVTGYSDIDATADTNYNIVTIKYDNNGNQVWMQPYNGSLNLNDISDAVAMDAFNNIYVAGHTNNGTSADPNYDMLVLRYDENGSLNWNTTFAGSADSIDVPNLVTIKGNDIYVAGSSWETNQQRDMLLLKYSGSLAVNEIKSTSMQFTVSPNPCADELIIKSTSSFNDIYTLNIYDVTGRCVLESILSQLNTFDISVLNSGYYEYKIISGNSVIQKGKLIHTKN